MKRIIAGILMASMLVTGLAGCGSKPVESEPSTAATTEITTADTTNTEASTTQSAADTTSASSAATSATNNTTIKAAQQTVAALAGKTYQPVSASLSGTITFSGSTSIYPAVAALTESFKKKYPNVKIQILRVTGSGTGLADAKAGTVSFGMRSSAFEGNSDETANPNIKSYKIAVDGVAVVVNNANSITDITIDQIKTVYQDGKLDALHLTAPVNRENGSGTRTCFTDIIKASDYKGVQVASTEAVATTVAGNEGAIGYMSLGSVGSNVKKLSVNGVAATEENVLNNSYKLSRPFVLLRRTDRPMSTAEKQFLLFALSQEGQKIIDNSHFIALAQSQINTEMAKFN